MASEKQPSERQSFLPTAAEFIWCYLEVVCGEIIVTMMMTDSPFVCYKMPCFTCLFPAISTFVGVHEGSPRSK